MTTRHPAHASADLDVTILGAGHIGFAIALLLKQAGGYRLTVADRDPSRLAEAAALGVHTQLLSDEPSLQAAVQGRFAVLNALPYHRAVSVATLCVQAGCITLI